MDIVEKDNHIFLKRNPIYIGRTNQEDAKIIRDYHDPDGFPTTEFRFDMWRRMTNNLLVRAPVEFLDLLFTTYMHDFWVHPECCSGKQYKVEIPQQDILFEGMSLAGTKVDECRKLFKRLKCEHLLMYHLKKNFTLCWDISKGEPSRITESCISCELGENENCNVCDMKLMYALEIVHRPEFWISIWPNLFISKPIQLGNYNIIYTCNTRSKKFTCQQEGDVVPSHYLPLGFAQLLRQCTRVEKVPHLTTLLYVYLRKRPRMCTLLPGPLQQLCAEWVLYLRPFERFISESAVRNPRVSVFCNWN